MPPATIFAAPGAALGYAAIAVAVLMLALWAASLRLRDVSIVDPAWGPMFVLIALVGAIAGTGDSSRRLLLLGLTAVWGLRLGAYLTRRKLVEPDEDRRYAQMRERHPKDFELWSLGAVFGLQGALALIISLPITVAAGRAGALGATVVPGVIVWAIGLAFEAIGD